MARLDIDFVASAAPAWRAGWWLLALAAVGVAVAALDVVTARDELAAAQARAERAAPGLRTTTARRAEATTPESQRAAQRAQRALARPWGLLWRELELRRPTDVAVLSIESGSSERANSVRLIGEARTVDQAVRWVEALRASPLVRSADLAHHERREGVGGNLVRFSIDLRWEGPQP